MVNGNELAIFDFNLKFFFIFCFVVGIVVVSTLNHWTLTQLNIMLQWYEWIIQNFSLFKILF